MCQLLVLLVTLGTWTPSEYFCYLVYLSSSKFILLNTIVVFIFTRIDVTNSEKKMDINLILIKDKWEFYLKIEHVMMEN